jgi:hypothetical protein
MYSPRGIRGSDIQVRSLLGRSAPPCSAHIFLKMEAKNIKLGDELYYLSRDRRIVSKGTVSAFRRSRDGRVVGVEVHNDRRPLRSSQILGPVVALEERPLVE